MPSMAVTGASGFIGGRIVDRFRADGWTVRPLVRGPRTADEARFDLRDPAFDERALDGVQVLVHCACAKGPDAFAVNVEGTRRLVRAARQHGVGRLVFFSSLSVSSEIDSAYGRQKRALEPEFDLVLRAALVLGNGGLFASLSRFLRTYRIAPLLNGGRQIVQTVHVNDLVEVLFGAVDGDVRGLLTVAAEPTTFRGLCEALCRAQGIRCRNVWLPGWLCGAGLTMAEALRVRLPVNSDNYRGLMGARAVATDDRVLGVRVRSCDESVRALAAG